MNTPISGSALVAGTSLLIVLFAVFGPNTVDNFYLFFTPLEAALFTAVVLISHKVTDLGQWIAALLLAAIANFFLNFLWALVLVIPFTVSEMLRLPEFVEQLLVWGFYSALGALIYGCILDAVIRPEYFRKRTHISISALCFLAAVPLSLTVLSQWESLVAHKAMWWALFGAAIWVESRNHSKENGYLTDGDSLASP